MQRSMNLHLIFIAKIIYYYFTYFIYRVWRLQETNNLWVHCTVWNVHMENYDVPAYASEEMKRMGKYIFAIFCLELKYASHVC